MLALQECGVLIRSGILFVSVCKKTLYVENHYIPFSRGSGLGWFIPAGSACIRIGKHRFFEQAGASAEQRIMSICLP